MLINSLKHKQLIKQEIRAHAGHQGQNARFSPDVPMSCFAVLTSQSSSYFTLSANFHNIFFLGHKCKPYAQSLTEELWTR